ncbi:DUF4469 domain-containing protein [Rubellicoccus peritrichatus]|uniref:DUF4469 domain-containing protein n=1 Tax=Rubellicoccus peritrichatus TaxID=3080537 RepID=A0AAQ3QVH8_9BACT|nr:DUF4469 domain-containing protein [Puniceicoccus sp. CR14]WOO41628.1 DUF4469 domain-containing protein [Puniceicoccus sp. CR14]
MPKSTLHYSIEPFTAIGAEDSAEPTYIGRVANSQTINEKALVQRLVDRYGVSEAAAKTVLLGLRNEVEIAMAEGNRVNLDGFVQFFPSIQGTFSKKLERADRKRHKVSVSTRLAPKLHKDINARVRWKRVVSTSPRPHISRILTYDMNEVEVANPGMILTLQGRHLKIDPKDSEEGVFIVPGQRKGSALRIESYGPVQPTSIIFQIPAELTQGDYHIEVRNRMRNSKRLSTARYANKLIINKATKEKPTGKAVKRKVTSPR